MMKMRCLLMVVGITLCPAVSRAQDTFLEWLDRLSGPGVFKPRVPAFEVRVFCGINGGRPNFLPSRYGNDKDHPYPCLENTFDAKWYVSIHVVPAASSDDKQFNETTPRTIHASIFEAFVRWRLHAAVDIGSGLGEMLFTGDRAVGGGDVSAHSFEIVPVSVVFRPLALVSGKNWGRIIVVRSDQALRIGTLTSNDFGNPALPSFPGYYQTDHEWNNRGGFLVDAAALIDSIRFKFKK